MQNDDDHIATHGKLTRGTLVRVAALTGAAWAIGTTGAKAQLTATRPGAQLGGLSARAPLEQGLYGMITPSELHFECSHSGVPNIDPDKHRLMVHGLVARPRIFTMDDLLRMSSVSRICFIECAGNGWDNRHELKPNLTVQETHGLISTTEWTGVPLSVLLDDVGADKKTVWMLAEGGDGAAVDRSIPLTTFIRENALIAYAQNGEPLRPAHGYPVRLLLPGFEGNMHIKWLRRLKFGVQPFMTRWETDTDTRLLPSGKEQFHRVQGVNSVITTPSGGMHMSNGFIEIRGLAWSGHGKIAKVEVTSDGGKTWTAAQLQGPILPQAQTRFRLPWSWNGQPALLQSRSTDDAGNVQPARNQLASIGSNGVFHYNAIQTWKIGANGGVTNAFA